MNRLCLLIAGPATFALSFCLGSSFCAGTPVPVPKQTMKVGLFPPVGQHEHAELASEVFQETLESYGFSLRRLEPVEDPWQAFANQPDLDFLVKLVLGGRTASARVFDHHNETVRRLESHAEEPIRDLAAKVLRHVSSQSSLKALVAKRRERASATLKENPKDFQSLVLLGLACYHESDYEQAQRYFHDAIQVDPADPDTLYSLALCHEKLGETAQMVKRLVEALDVHPHHEGASIALANVHLESGRFHEAIAVYNRWLDSPQNASLAHWNLAVAYHQQGHLREALSQLRQIERSDPQYVRAQRMILDLEAGRPDSRREGPTNRQSGRGREHAPIETKWYRLVIGVCVGGGILALVLAVGAVALVRLRQRSPQSTGERDALGCSNRDQLSAFICGSLPTGELESLADHLVDCADCQSILEGLAPAPDTFLAELDRSLAAGGLAEQPECQEAVARYLEVGREPVSRPDAAADDAARAGQAHIAEQIGPYRLLAKLGEGGMGVVYKALHTKLDKVVAIKTLPARLTQDPAIVARFAREMKAVGRLAHPNIVGAYDAGEVEGTHYLVMEYVEGIDLSQLSKQRGPLPLADACELVRQAAVGLAHAHEHGMVHRDIKPSNLMLAVSNQPSAVGSSGQPAIGTSHFAIVKILDLGLARLDEARQADRGHLTNTGQVMGTIDYMPPDQVASSHDVDARADIYGLGATLYKLLAGTAPFEDPRYDTPLKKLAALATEPMPSLGARRDDLPPDLVALVDKMIAREPGGRFASAGEVAEALVQFAQGAELADLLARCQADGAAKHSSSAVGTEPHISLALIDTTAVAKNET